MNQFLAYIRTYRLRLLVVMIYAFAFSLLAVALNFMGLKSVNLVIGCVLPIFACWLVTNPVVLTGGVAARTLDKKVLNFGASLFGNLVLCLSFFFLVAGTVTFTRNYSSIFAIYLATFVIFLTNVVWGMKTKIAKKLVYWYAVLVLVLALGSLLSGASYTKVMSFDPYSFFRVSKVDDLVFEINSIKEAKAEKTEVAQLEVIKAKLKKGETLDKAEASKLASISSKVADSSLPAKAKAVITSGAKPKVATLVRLSWDKSTTTLIPVYLSEPGQKLTSDKGENMLHGFSLLPGKKVWLGDKGSVRTANKRMYVNVWPTKEDKTIVLDNPDDKTVVEPSDDDLGNLWVDAENLQIIEETPAPKAKTAANAPRKAQWQWLEFKPGEVTVSNLVAKSGDKIILSGMTAPFLAGDRSTGKNEPVTPGQVREFRASQDGLLSIEGDQKPGKVLIEVVPM